jgi:hypothetical protein
MVPPSMLHLRLRAEFPTARLRTAFCERACARFM